MFYFVFKVVVKVEATDSDITNKNLERNSANGVKFSIIKGNPQSNFIIDENTGNFYLLNVLLIIFRLYCDWKKTFGP